MVTQEIIQEFFEEQFNNTSPFFLYKDKQLLKNGEFREYAREQIKKANKIFWSVGSGLFFCSYYGIVSFIEYGANPNWFDLILGLTAWLGLIAALFYSAKEYYTIKSSMSFFIKLLNNQETDTDNQHQSPTTGKPIE